MRRHPDSAVWLPDPRTGESSSAFSVTNCAVGFVALSGDGRYLATTSDAASVRIWDLEHPLEQRPQ
ncbi:hypothetical protein D6C00_06140 [Thiohalobacter thiocyanaticus]|uniref:WD40 repeat domain-containing protein n=1 Tax=Thiohalobacter thiocyanaticus TaxID=585455 RepID=A0A426QII8_9GAMM|nr:hypothetical protein D6C00_06140 [Thiohalobacter thiocyanaticus]